LVNESIICVLDLFRCKLAPFGFYDIIYNNLSCLKGEWIEKISANKVLFEKGDVLDMEKLDPQLLKPLLRW